MPKAPPRGEGYAIPNPKKHLTLRLDERSIREAKILAAQEGTSVSTLPARWVETCLGQQQAYQAAHKRDVAAQLLRDLWTAHAGVVSTGVLEEFYRLVTLEPPHSLTPARAPCSEPTLRALADRDGRRRPAPRRLGTGRERGAVFPRRLRRGRRARGRR